MGFFNGIGALSNNNTINTHKAHPFLNVLKPKQSEFQITVPTAFCFDSEKGNAQNRHLWFSDFRIVPSFFSEKASALKMDSEEELSIVEEHNFQLDTMWTKLFLPKETNEGTDKRETIQFNQKNYDAGYAMLELNKIGVKKKIPAQKFPPVFCDWVHLEIGDTQDLSGSKSLSRGGVEETERQNTFASSLVDSTNKLCEKLYGVRNLEEKHKISMLNQELQEFPGANNFAWPNPNSDLGVRVRLFLQPGCSITMSNFNIFRLLGFHQEQVIGKRQFSIHNYNSDEWKVVTALRHPRTLLEHKDDPVTSPTKISIQYRSQNQITTSKKTVLSITKKDFLNDDNFAQEIKKIIDILALDMNVNLDINGLTLTFPPKNNYLTHCCLQVSTTVSKRLGYGAHNKIDENSVKVNPIDSDFQVQAKTLVYDTGIAYLKAKNTISNLLTNDNELFILSLEPASEGILKMTPSMTSTFHASTMFSGSHEMDLPFKIYTIQPDGQHVPLCWLSGAYIYGNLWSKV